MSIGWCGCIVLGFSKKYEQKSFTLHWRPYLDGSDIITNIFTNRGGECIDYEFTPMHSALSVRDESPEIIDDQLRIIFKRW